MAGESRTTGRRRIVFVYRIDIEHERHCGSSFTSIGGGRKERVSVAGTPRLLKEAFLNRKLGEGYNRHSKIDIKTERKQKGIDIRSPSQSGLMEVKLIGTCHPASMTVNIQNQAGCCSVKKRSLYVSTYHERRPVRNEGLRASG